MLAQEMTADESRLRNIAAMGEHAGSIYSQLWQELARLYRTWAEYVALFGTKESRVALLNEAAPAFTRIVQDFLWEGVILHIARLTDPPKSMGKPNLSVRALEDAVSDPELKAKVSASVSGALLASEFCRDWRNRQSRLKVKEALDGLSEVLNVLTRHYFDSTTIFDLDLHVGGGPGGAMSLLYFIDLGVQADKSREARLKSGHFDPNDYRPCDQ
ncbi:MAG: hypothetical protein B7X59_11000 [Polaromonas sp. 39-63-203]|nr:MAG: hypothetical protein B7X59_11000 [Polaromonas sp. 39-63-203]